MALSANQTKAIFLLASGETVTATAEAIGLSRQTVSQWVNNDPEFQAELNRMRKEMLNSATDRLRALTAQALEAVENGLKSNELTAKEKAALGMDLLKQIQLTEQVITVGPTNPKAVEQMQFLDEVLYA